ncbi:hypothetical protein NCU17126 [Neurospora crassa OR74A]|uniref:Uncharacterized protein n=1 Tax=Neurospora crassa (strain ATCC 24698 / 74-OR23-1A / CBS 708.71 / DSM 1257 / FGSC 987) TaxID=367110 RepID=V5INC7_NEUCR|nr:hypothetical protein NCU17126 [Neurospora crassa OR74A]ESA42276.1 hypothetical protein NCU17126 [Neurospora crassa OR74A]|eukprot:XP_011395100.1 hypothetical protein NCU17126 [Neurospora crassa OR74A]
MPSNSKSPTPKDHPDNARVSLKEFTRSSSLSCTPETGERIVAFLEELRPVGRGRFRLAPSLQRSPPSKLRKRLRHDRILSRSPRRCQVAFLFTQGAHGG